jgi:hypothetical protein
MPESFRLPRGFESVEWKQLKVDLEAGWLNSGLARQEGYLDGTVDLVNPGPYYWVAGPEQGVILGALLISTGGTREIGFPLPHDLYPGDRLKLRVRIPLNRITGTVKIFLNGMVRGPGQAKRWFPAGNRVLAWESSPR